MLESTVNRMGISNSVFVKCDCGMTEFLATGDHPSNDTTPRTIQGKDLNRRIVYGTFEMGVGKEGIAKLCEMLNMPFSISLSTWYEHEEALLKAHYSQRRECKISTRNTELPGDRLNSIMKI